MDVMGQLQVVGREAGGFCDAREHARANFIAVVKRENVIRPLAATQYAVRAGLTFDRPSDA